ncbi:MAG: pyridoxine 5'-phosphate synthase [SAR86 cluster bacterium]|uniref:Pyridoxine 5'-phosphate synthase n=1 Tax=SAR86 cluster bacterium TaxID=2030880 RepID=A0A520MQZ5_9GAMM|nr:MAG: pyridoxine 5'-phosphate synthase [SAR86 cluster bacterium]
MFIRIFLTNMKLSINLNKIALLRNSRGSNNPDIAEYAITALEENILGLTVHPRPDNRHITYDDLICIKNLTDEYNKEFNIEGNPQEVASLNYKGFIPLIEEFKPTQATLVPDATNQLTSDHGWAIQDLNSANYIHNIKKNCTRCSVFINAGANLNDLKNEAIDSIEIYTGPFAAAVKQNNADLVDKELSKIIYTSEIAKQRNMRVNAGHDLDLINLPYLIETNLIDEVSIGHAIISESLNQGFKKTINQYIELING